ncbi:MAG: sugar phosphate isomerase/epimerase [Thermoproteota archaeon]|nr:sugar phosphate isomerase/epimerase [Candidatus Brockarchaeota archaeon]MBO3768540.1 sugar phosphate isomerase/epimerase [Candidatus Brockarchaeota archaeon]MBO3801564.1 sugar phosphate isomerase/epimerase [Candidatus Brockarchaeota archaeon]
MKLSICNELFKGWSLEKTFHYVNQLGYNGIEIAPFTIASSVEKISEEKRSEIRREANRNGLEVVGTHWILVTSNKNLKLFKDNGETNKETIDYLKEVVKFTSEIGGKIVVFGSPKQRNIPSREIFEQAWSSAVSAFKEVGDLAKEESVTICIEPLSRDQTNFINNVREANKFIDEVNHENIKLILDVRSMCDEGRPFSDIIIEGKKNLRHFHSNDCNGYIPGSGSANYKQIVQGLLKIEYSGYLSVEVFDFKPNAETIATKSLENLREFLKNLET